MGDTPLGINVEFIKNLNETLILSDTYSEIWVLSRTYSDDLKLVDNLIKQLERTYSDTLELSDLKTKQTIKLLNDSIDTSDNISNIADFSRIYADTIELSDPYCDPKFIFPIGVQFIKNFSEGIVLNSLSKFDTNKSLGDEIILTDNYNKIWILSRTYSDELDLSDNLTKNFSRVYSDGLSISDGDTNIISRLLSEYIRLTDVYSRGAWNPARIYLDTFDLSAYCDPKFVFPIHTEFIKNLRDNLTLSDLYNRTWNSIKICSDTLNLSDGDVKDIITRILTENLLAYDYPGARISPDWLVDASVVKPTLLMA